MNLWLSGGSLIGAIYLSSALDIIFLLSNKKGEEVQLEMLLGGVGTYLFTRCVAPFQLILDNVLNEFGLFNAHCSH